MMLGSENRWRATTQVLAPACRTPAPEGAYDVYPPHEAAPGEVGLGFAALAERLAAHPRVVLDGYGGVFWENLRAELDAAFQRLTVRVHWIDASEAFRAEHEIEALIQPFLGGDDPLFGTRFTGELGDFFRLDKLRAQRPDPGATLSILYGCGAALAGWEGYLAYVDVPKNEIQFRSRAGAIRNLGACRATAPKAMYKRFYFVDWPALNRHKARLLPRLDLVLDGQRPATPTFMSGAALRSALSRLSRSCFRARPWFEPGPWGGQWIKRHVRQLPQEAPNYAWSFELIAPENGLIFCADERLCEVSLDFLMFHDHHAVLGACAERFGYEFPIRFDWLDTFDGGNLSLQCHPHPEYARRHFGERFTQDETYYILDCAPGAEVYLGFRAGVEPAAFRAELERSVRQNAEFDVRRFVNTEPASRHDLFLIPHGTVHCSGKNNLVLEISATPYIFTFKMYDWRRMDLDGRPRPLNLQRAFDNLDFTRQGGRVQAELVARARPVRAGLDWQVVHLPTHPDHFYDIHRFEFTREITAATADSPQVLSLVEGQAVSVETPAGGRRRFHYAETFVIPAAAGQCRLINEGRDPVKVVAAFIKPQAATPRPA
jgi:mannose-6-phosphate isomerase class I